MSASELAQPEAQSRCTSDRNVRLKIRNHDIRYPNHGEACDCKIGIGWTMRQSSFCDAIERDLNEELYTGETLRSRLSELKQESKNERAAQHRSGLAV